MMKGVGKMKRIFLIVVVIGLVGASLAIPASAADAGFIFSAQGLENWSRREIDSDWSATYYYTNPNRTLRFLTNGSEGFGDAFLEDLPLVAGRTYRLRFRPVLSGTISGTGRNASMTIKVIGSADYVNLLTSGQKVWARSGLFNLSLLEVTFVCPSTIGSPSIVFMCSSTSTSNVAFNLVDFDVYDVSPDIGIRNDINNAGDRIVSNQDANAQKVQDGINNAGENEPGLDTDRSGMEGAISNLNDWMSQVDTFSASIKDAGGDAKTYIQHGTDVFTELAKGFPAIVSVLILFGIIFIVVRKIVGR